MGYAFTYPMVSLLARIPIGAYVHYPTISTDMLARVRSRQPWHTNDDQISSSAVLSRMKLMWVHLFPFIWSVILSNFLLPGTTASLCTTMVSPFEQPPFLWSTLHGRRTISIPFFGTLTPF